MSKHYTNIIFSIFDVTVYLKNRMMMINIFSELQFKADYGINYEI